MCLEKDKLFLTSIRIKLFKKSGIVKSIFSHSVKHRSDEFYKGPSVKDVRKILPIFEPNVDVNSYLTPLPPSLYVSASS